MWWRAILGIYSAHSNEPSCRCRTQSDYAILRCATVPPSIATVTGWDETLFRFTSLTELFVVRIDMGRYCGHTQSESKPRSPYEAEYQADAFALNTLIRAGSLPQDALLAAAAFLKLAEVSTSGTRFARHERHAHAFAQSHRCLTAPYIEAIRDLTPKPVFVFIHELFDSAAAYLSPVAPNKIRQPSSEDSAG